MKASYKIAFAFFTILILISAILLPRTIGLDRFVTVDEPIWLIGTANFYYALGQRDFVNTFVANHPAVPTMWIITAGFLMYFPEYRGLGQGYVWKYRDYDQIFAKFNKRPLELLKISRLIYVIINTLLLLVAFWLIRYLYGNIIAWVATLLVAFDPYFLGHSRLLNHETMMSLFILISFFAAMVFIEKNRHWIFWVISSISAGLALLTISPSVIIIPLVGLMLLVKYVSQWKKQKLPGLSLSYLKLMVIYASYLSLTFVVLWPGMWVNPGKMLNLVFGNALSYAFQGANLNVTKEINPSRFGLEITGITPYIVGLFWRTTPVTWLGTLFACIGLFIKDHSTFTPVVKKSIIYLGSIAVLFVLMFGIAKGRNSPHYIMMSYVCLEVIAGIGLVGAIRWVGERFTPARQGWVMIVLVTSLLGVHIAGGISQFPYYYTYLNPLMEYFMKGNPNQGYGEGLEKAGEYLSQKPNASELTAISWFGYGPFSYFFSGQSIHMPPTDFMEPSLLENIHRSNYLVVYDIYQIRHHMPGLLMDALNGITPETVIMIDGMDYVSIYKVVDLPESLFNSIDQ